MPRPRIRSGSIELLASALLALGAPSCVGDISETPAPDTDSDRGPPMTPEVEGSTTFVPRTAIRRLSAAELRSTIDVLLGLDAGEFLTALPEDARPFDTDYKEQTPSRPLVEAIASIVQDVVHRASLDPAVRRRIIPCTTNDDACMTQFIQEFGRRAIRRPLDLAEVAELRDLANLSPGQFDVGVAAVMEVLLQDVEFLYRVERGVPTKTPDLVRLDSWEIASRLSYTLWGTMPNDDLFELAAANAFGTPTDIRKVAGRMLRGTLGSPEWGRRARDRVNRFHAMLLGYEDVVSPTSVLGFKMYAETNALLERVIFDQRSSWLQLLLSQETFLDRQLAEHYGHQMHSPPAGAPAKWAGYGTTGRQGILSHGTVLSVASSPADTSVTLRGKFLRNQLLCQNIAPPPKNAMVDGKRVDTSKPPEPAPGDCRIDALRKTTLSPGCNGCHSRMDLIGLGLENYDRDGRYRANDTDKPNCPISGRGQYETVDSSGQRAVVDFDGPKGLSELLVETEGKTIGRCLVTQVFRFVVGRPARPEETPFIDAITESFETGLRRFDSLLLDYVSSPGFSYRLVE